MCSEPAMTHRPSPGQAMPNSIATLLAASRNAGMMQSEHGARPSALDSYAKVREWISEEIPELESAIDQVVDRLAHFVSAVHAVAEHHPGLGALVNQATNDFVDLLYDLAYGRGRPALKATRSLFDLLVTAHDIVSTTELAERYAAHRWVIAHDAAKLSFETDALSGKDRGALNHLRKKVDRQTRDRAEAALKRYGPGFRRSWTPTSLRDRAERHDLAEEYEFYRLGSAVLHGSAGGTLGLERLIDGRRVHRAGPALSLCPIAFLMGCRFFSALCDLLEGKIDAILHRDLIAEIETLRGLWPRYRSTMYRIDDELWPEVAPPGLLAVLAVGHGGIRQWYLHDGERGVIRRAHPPTDVDPCYAARIDDLVKEIEEQPLRDDIVSIAFADVRVSPVAGAPWMPEDRILVHKQLQQWGRDS